MASRVLGCMAAAVFVFGCASPGGDHDVDDHSLSIVTLEGDEIVRALDVARASQVHRAVEPFVRLAIMWDAMTDGVLELRVSADGATWSPWQAPEIIDRNPPAHVGRVDLDAEATHFQFRIPGQAAAPSFLVIEPLADAAPDPAPEDFVDELGDDFADEASAEDGIGSAEQAISTAIGAVRIYSKREWGGRAPRCALSRMTPNRATIHHTVTPTNDSMSPQARLRQIQAFHMFSRGWCDIGYNYLISRDGRVWRGRGAVHVGAHVANSNTGNIGISFMGTHTSTPATKAQLCSAARLLRRLHQDFGGLALTRTDVKGHRQYGGTSCPGAALYNQIDDILRKAKNGCSTN